MLSGGGEAVSRALGRPAPALRNAGGLGTLVFGVWLALDIEVNRAAPGTSCLGACVHFADTSATAGGWR